MHQRKSQSADSSHPHQDQGPSERLKSRCGECNAVYVGGGSCPYCAGQAKSVEREMTKQVSDNDLHKSW